MMRIAILDDYQRVALRLADWSSLARDTEIDVFADHIFDLDSLVTRLLPYQCIVLMRERTPFSRILFESLPNLRLLVTSGRRNAAIDVEAATERGVQVCGTNLKGMGTAELTWALILALLRNVVAEDRALQRGEWQTTLGVELAGKTLGILGLGRLGSEVARIGAAFHMKTIAWSPHLTAERATAAGALAVSKEGLFSEADIVTIHLVLSEETRGLVGPEDFGRMKRTAFLVNTSRGPIVDGAALLAALRDRKLAGAGIDVFEIEPLPLSHPLRGLDNVVLTPHLGYVTEENYRHHFPQVVDIIHGFIEGKVIMPMNAPAVLPPRS